MSVDWQEPDKHGPMFQACVPISTRGPLNDCVDLVRRTILTYQMSEPTRRETQLGIADLKKRLGAVGLNIVEQWEETGRRATHFAIGTNLHQTDIVLSHEFLDDLPNTKDYHPIVDSYARSVAGRLKCGSPELFYCLSGVAVRVSIRWPIQTATHKAGLPNVVLTVVMNQLTGQVAKCSMEVKSGFGQTIFHTVLQAVNSVRAAIDEGSVRFYDPNANQEVYEGIKCRQEPHERRSKSEVERFLTGKAYILGFHVDHKTEVWATDRADFNISGSRKKICC